VPIWKQNSRDRIVEAEETEPPTKCLTGCSVIESAYKEVHYAYKQPFPDLDLTIKPKAFSLISYVQFPSVTLGSCGCRALRS